MAKKRPTFNVPPSNTTASAPPAEWVYRTDSPEPVATPAVQALAVLPEPASQPSPVATQPAPQPLAMAPASAAIITRHCRYASTVGFIPIPLVDIAAITAIQVKMVAALAERHKLDFDHQLAKALVVSVVAAISGRAVAFRIARRLMQAVPALGTAARLIVDPMSAYAATWTVGQLFDQHFAKGGTLFDFDGGSAVDASSPITT